MLPLDLRLAVKIKYSVGITRFLSCSFKRFGIVGLDVSNMTCQDLSNLVHINRWLHLIYKDEKFEFALFNNHYFDRLILLIFNRFDENNNTFGMDNISNDKNGINNNNNSHDSTSKKQRHDTINLARGFSSDDTTANVNNDNPGAGRMPNTNTNTNEVATRTGATLPTYELNGKVNHSQRAGARTQNGTNATGTLTSGTDLRNGKISSKISVGPHSLELTSNANSEEMSDKQNQHTKSSGSENGNINGIFWYHLTFRIDILVLFCYIQFQSYYLIKNYINQKQYYIMDLNYWLHIIQLIHCHLNFLSQL